MVKTTTLAPIRIAPETKAEATRILESMGLTTSTAVVLFLNQVIVEGGLPFRPSTRAVNTVPSPKARLPELSKTLMKRYDEAFKELAK